MSRVPHHLTAVLLALGCALFASAQTTTPAPPAVSAETAAGLRIASGDLLQISVYGAPDFNNEVRVAENGSVSLPLVGTMPAAGMTALQFTDALKSRLVSGGYFNNPQVSVFVKEYASAGVSVLGEVQKPGIIPLLGAHTLFDAISAAGGTTPVASNKVTITHRDRPRESETVTLNYTDKTGQGNIPVTPGDTIVVQRAGTMYVIGNVQKPTEVVLANPNLTVLQAIAIAQGIAPGAALDKAKLVRDTPEGRKEVPLPLRKILAGKSDDVRLQANDILFVPGSLTKSAAKTSLEAAIRTVTGLAMYGHF